MSLNGALYNALSGLRANARSATLISTNISNATTESYGRRELALSSGVTGGHGGVIIDGVLRNVDAALVADRRVSDAALGFSDARFAFTSGLEAELGDSDTAGSLTNLVTSLENALINAASNPASTQRLENVATVAADLTTKMNSLTDHIQEARETADRTIGTQVDSINSAMARLKEINTAVIKSSATGGDTASLLDERARILDSVSEIVPLRVVPRDDNAIAVFTEGGATLLDGQAYELGFEPTATIDANMTMEDGDLSGLTLNGVAISSTGGGMLAGGALGAQFELRDSEAVTRQAQLDGIARDLIERFGPGGPDSTLLPGDPGLFTDAGLAFDSADETGIAGRISLNALVEPGSGGSWRLRDGLGAATQGEVGDATLLNDISAALEAATLPASSALPAVAASFINQVANFTSDVAGARVRQENEVTFSSAQNVALKEQELADGVDTDLELQRLMEVEQLYTANAKVMTTVDELLERLMSI